MNLPDFLFHGTNHDFDVPTVSGDGDLLWTTDKSTVAQNYISACSGYTSTRHIFGSEFTTPVKPDLTDPFYAVVRLMGHQAIDPAYDRNGNALSFSTPPGYPSYEDAIRYIENVLGYTSENNYPKSYRIKTTGWDSEARHDILAPENYKDQGYLHIISGHAQMRMFDMTDLEHNQHVLDQTSLTTFEKIRQEGYDGVIMNDFCRSRKLGQVEHLTYGFFPDAIPDLVMERIPAKNFDWEISKNSPRDQSETPEFSTWKAAKLAMGTLLSSLQNNQTLSLSELRRRSSISHS